MGVLEIFGSRLPEKNFSVKRFFGKCVKYFSNLLKVLAKFPEFYQNIFEGVDM